MADETDEMVALLAQLNTFDDTKAEHDAEPYGIPEGD